MSTYQRQPGDLAIQVYVPADVGLEIGKLRLTTRQTNNAIVTELLREALQARGLLASSATTAPVAAPTNAGMPTESGMPGKASKAKAKKDQPGPTYSMKNPAKSVAAAVRQAKASQEHLAKLSKPVEVSVQDTVVVADAVEPVVVEATPVVPTMTIKELTKEVDYALAVEQGRVWPADEHIDTVGETVAAPAPVTTTADDDPFAEFADQLDYYIEIGRAEEAKAKAVAPAPAVTADDDDDAIDIAALAFVDEPRVERNPFACLDDDDIVTNPFDLS